MEVKDFSDEIEEIVRKNIKGRTYHPILAYALGGIEGFATYLTDFLSMRFAGGPVFFGNPIYHASGPVSFAANNFADEYITHKTFELFEDPHFQEYGLDKFYKEVNAPFPKERKPLSKKQKLIKATGGVLSFIFPSCGHAFAASTIIAYGNNDTVRKRVKDEIKIGDEVKRMIEAGLSKEDINQRLDLLRNKKETCKKCRESHNF